MLFGLGSISKIIMTVLAAVFPILINTMVGIANTDVRLITMARAFGARDSQIFLKVSLPGSLPYIVAGIRVALGRALVYIVVAEQYGAAMGLGYLSSVAAQRFQMAAMFVPIIIIAGLGAGLTELLKLLERRLDKWKPEK
jgi:NitT/TauT family transport system permease protein